MNSALKFVYADVRGTSFDFDVLRLYLKVKQNRVRKEIREK